MQIVYWLSPYGYCRLVVALWILLYSHRLTAIALWISYCCYCLVNTDYLLLPCEYRKSKLSFVRLLIRLCSSVKISSTWFISCLVARSDIARKDYLFELATWFTHLESSLKKCLLENKLSFMTHFLFARDKQWPMAYGSLLQEAESSISRIYFIIYFNWKSHVINLSIWLAIDSSKVENVDSSLLEAKIGCLL